MLTCRLSRPSGETMRSGAPWAVLEQVSASEVPVALAAFRQRAGQQLSGGLGAVGVERDLEKHRVAAAGLVDDGRQQRRELARDHAARGAAQPRACLVGLPRQRVDVAQKRPEFEVLVEVERQQLGQQRQPLRARQVAVGAGGHLLGLALQQRADQLAEHRRAQVGLGFLALVAQRLRVVLGGDRDLTLLERVGRVQADDGGRDRQQRDRQRVDDVGRELRVFAPVAAGFVRFGHRAGTMLNCSRC